MRKLEEVFRKVPGVTSVRRQGGAGDHGADILVAFEAGFPIPGLDIEYSVVVQIKSFIGDHRDTRALEDLKEESGKPVALLIGPDVAAFLLRFGAKLLA